MVKYYKASSMKLVMRQVCIIIISIPHHTQIPKMCNRTRKRKEICKCRKGRNEFVIVFTWKDCVHRKLKQLYKLNIIIDKRVQQDFYTQSQNTKINFISIY